MRIINLCKEREQIHNYDISWHSWGLLHRCLLENSDLSLPYYYSRWIKGLSGQEFNCGEEDNILYRTLSQIPIYLVTHDQCKKTYEIDLFGHIEGVTVPEDKYGHFDNDETAPSKNVDFTPFFIRCNYGISFFFCLFALRYDTKYDTKIYSL